MSVYSRFYLPQDEVDFKLQVKYMKTNIYRNSYFFIYLIRLHSKSL